jgi:hypothetical protein
VVSPLRDNDLTHDDGIIATIDPEEVEACARLTARKRHRASARSIRQELERSDGTTVVRCTMQSVARSPGANAKLITNKDGEAISSSGQQARYAPGLPVRMSEQRKAIYD